MYRTFTGNTQLEVTAVIARCGTNTGEAADAIKTWIETKQAKGKPTDNIVSKLEGMEARYLVDPSICEAFHQARALTALPRSKVLPASENFRPSPTPDLCRRSRDSDESTVKPRRSLESVSVNFGASPTPSRDSDGRTIKSRRSLESTRQSVRPRSRTVSAPSLAASKSPTSSQSLPPSPFHGSSSASPLNLDPMGSLPRQSSTSRHKTTSSTSRTTKPKLPIPRQSLPALPPRRPRLDSSIFPFYEPDFPLCSPAPLGDVPSLPIQRRSLLSPHLPVREVSEDLIDSEFFIPPPLEPLPSHEEDTAPAELDPSSDSEAPSPISSSSYPQTPINSSSPGSPSFTVANDSRHARDEEFWYRPLPPPPPGVEVVFVD